MPPFPEKSSSIQAAWSGMDGIRHVNITSSADPAEITSQDRMTVFWLGDFPVGHLFHDDSHEKKLEILATTKRSQEKEETHKFPLLSATIVICTYNRPAELKRCLISLTRQSLQAQEIIVVDNASPTDDSHKIAAEMQVIYVREDRRGLDYARNSGVLKATSDLVVFVDDDVIVQDRWLEKMVTAFDSPEIGAVTGLILPAELSTDAQSHFEKYWGFGQGYQTKNITSAIFRNFRGVYPAWNMGAGASMAFRREVFFKIGLFDERLDVGRAGCSGDSEYWYRLLANDYTCRYEPSSVAFHFHRREWKDLGKQIYAYMRGHSASLLIQFERTHIKANLSLALYWKPLWYLRRSLRAMIKGPRPEDKFLKEEITGYISGILYYLRNYKKI